MGHQDSFDAVEKLFLSDESYFDTMPELLEYLKEAFVIIAKKKA